MSRRHDFETIEIEYNGRTLVFHEKDDEWSCRALDLKAKSLTALKRKIDKLDGEIRRVSIFAVQLSTSGYYEKVGSQVQIVMIAKGQDWERMRYDEQPQKLEGLHDRRVPTVWVMVADGNKMERKKIRLDALALPSDEVKSAIAEFERLGEEIEKLKRQREAAFKAIPRLTIDDLTPKGVREENLEYDL